MSKPSAVGVFFFSFFFMWFYQIYWLVQTKKEMTELGCDIPSAWLMIVPFASIYWDWKYCEGVESVTLGEYSAGIIFLILQLKYIIAIILVMVVIATRESPSDLQKYYKYVVLATGALSLAILQSIFNSVDKSVLSLEDKWKPGSESQIQS